MLSLIDVEPMKDGWGRIYQSGVLASEDWDQDGLMVSMAGNTNFRGPCLWIFMLDDEESVLPRMDLLSMADAIIAFLGQGNDVLIHCIEGKYRSTYMDVAVHIRAGMTFDAAYALVKKQHPIADLRKGTEAQLRTL